MQSLLRSALFAAVALAPAASLAQILVQEPAVVVGEPAVVVEEPAVIVEQPVVVGPAGIGVEDARAIAMMNGMVAVEEVDTRWRDGNFEVEGTDASGNDLEMVVDSATGAVLSIDD